MAFVGRRDRILLAGLALALLVVFLDRGLTEQPIRYLRAFARDVERSSGLALIPALLILHQQGKRQESKAQAPGGGS